MRGNNSLHILKITNLNSSLSQHPNPLDILQPQRLLVEQERLKRELTSDNLNLALEPLFKTFENEDKEGVKEIEDFVVVLVKGHFEVEADEFGHVAVRVGVFGSEDLITIDVSILLL
jgi:hypothetical protein